jgi:hypothetical protein
MYSKDEGVNMRAGRFGQEKTTYLTASFIYSRREGQVNGNNLRRVSYRDVSNCYLLESACHI